MSIKRKDVADSYTDVNQVKGRIVILAVSEIFVIPQARRRNPISVSSAMGLERGALRIKLCLQILKWNKY